MSYRCVIEKSEAGESYLFPIKKKLGLPYGALHSQPLFKFKVRFNIKLNLDLCLTLELALEK